MNNEQLKAIKSVERAFRKAYKLNLDFWSNYGRVTAYDTTEVTQPLPEGMADGDVAYNPSDIDCDYFIELDRGIDISMNSDDTLTFAIKQEPEA
jgi:hypothetical protein